VTDGKEEGTRAAVLVTDEVMEVVHDGAAQMAEHDGCCRTEMSTMWP
jgi:hypothetical protein